jgi:hypothetical protein
LLDDTADLRSTALTSRRFNLAAQGFLWRAVNLPTFKLDSLATDQRSFWDRFASHWRVTPSRSALIYEWWHPTFSTNLRPEGGSPEPSIPSGTMSIAKSATYSMDSRKPWCSHLAFAASRPGTCPGFSILQSFCSVVSTMFLSTPLKYKDTVISCNIIGKTG